MQDYDAIMNEQVRTYTGGTILNIQVWPLLAQPYVKSWDVFKCPSWSYNMIVYTDPVFPNWVTKPMSYVYNKSCKGYWVLNPAYEGKQGFCTNIGIVMYDAQVEDPAGTIWLAEGGYRNTGPIEDRVMGIWGQLAYEWHNDYHNNTYMGGSSSYWRRVGNPHFDGFNATFGDGHAKWVKWKSGTPRMYTIEAD
ncbi:MAG: hypothetical protein HY321_19115, partial [Armatimonadetes bacterium]|nr:hypothetical protein [Armatimonadota bacterium]